MPDQEPMVNTASPREEPFPVVLISSGLLLSVVQLWPLSVLFSLMLLPATNAPLNVIVMLT